VTRKKGDGYCSYCGEEEEEVGRLKFSKKRNKGGKRRVGLAEKKRGLNWGKGRQ